MRDGERKRVAEMLHTTLRLKVGAGDLKQKLEFSDVAWLDRARLGVVVAMAEALERAIREALDE